MGKQGELGGNMEKHREIGENVEKHGKTWRIIIIIIITLFL